MVGDQPRRRQVLFEQRQRHGERFARVVKPGLVGRIDWELARRPDIDSRQIANGVVELGVAQTTGQNRPGVVRVALAFPFLQIPNPGDHRGALIRFGLARRCSGGISSP